MKSILYSVILAVISLLIISSCMLPPDEALENFMNPYIELHTKLKLPLIATKVRVDEFVVNSLKDAAGDLGLDFIEKNGKYYFHLEKEATLLDLNDLQKEVEKITGSEEIANFVRSFKVDVDPANLELPILSPVPPPDSSVTVNQGVPNVTIGPLPVYLGVTSSTVASITVNGELLLTLEFGANQTGEDLDMNWVNVIVQDEKGNTLVNETYDEGSPGVLKTTNCDDTGMMCSYLYTIPVDLSGKDVVLGTEGKLGVSLTIDLNNNTTNGGYINYSITPDMYITAFKDATIVFMQPINLPENVNSLIVTSGSLMLSSDEMYFEGATGTIESDTNSGNAKAVDGEITFYLLSVSLPATVHLNQISGKLLNSAGEVNSITLDEGFSEDTLVDAELQLDENSNFSFKGSETIDLPEGYDISKIKFKTGKVSFDYISGLPVKVNLKVWSEQMKLDNAPMSELFAMNAGENSSIEINFPDYDIEPSGTQIVIWYDASPAGYNAENKTLTLNEASISVLDNMSLSSVLNWGDFSLDWLDLSNFATTVCKTLDLEKGGILNILDSMDLNGTFTINEDINGGVDATLMEYKNEVLKDTRPISVDVESGEANITDILKLLASMIKNDPDRIDYELGVRFGSLHLDFSNKDAVTMTLEIEAPADFTLDASKLIYSTEEQELGDLPATITMLELIFSGTNTTGITPVIEFYINGKKKDPEVTLDSTFNSSVLLNKEDLYPSNGEKAKYMMKVWLIKGRQIIRPDGFVDFRLKTNTDLQFGGGGDESEGGENNEE